MTNRVVVLTSSYPLDQKETFLIDELPFLKSSFEELVLFPVDKQGEVNNCTELKVLQLKELKFNSFWKLLKAFGVREFRRELLLLFRRGHKHGIQRFKTLAVSWQKSESILNELRIFSQDGVPTVFYAYWGMESAIAVSRLKFEAPQITAVSRFHGWDVYENVHETKYLPFRDLISDNLDYLFPISKNATRLILEKWRPKGVVETHYLGTFNTEQTLNPKPSSTDVPLILSISNFNDVKRLPLFIDVFSQIKQPVKWVHIGDGSNRESIQLLAESSLPENAEVLFLGEKTHREVMEFLNTTPVTCLLNLSSSEGVPVSMMEVQSRGIPVFGTRVGGVSEIINSNTGFLVDPFAPSEKIASDLEDYLEFCSQSEIRKSCYRNWLENFDGAFNFQNFSTRLTKCLTESKPKLLLLTSSFPYNFEEAFFSYELNELYKRFEKIVVVATDTLDAKVQFKLPSHVLTTNATKHKRFKIKLLTGLLFSISFWKELFQILRSKNIPLIMGTKTLVKSYFRTRLLYHYLTNHIRTDQNWFGYALWTDDSAVALAMLQHKNRLKSFVSRLNGWDLYLERSSANYLPFRHYINKWASGFFCSSNAGKKYFHLTYPEHAHKCSVAYLGVLDQQDFKVSEEVENKEKVLISCSNIIPIKRVDLIVDTLSQFTNERIHWIHYGDGIDKPLIQSKIKNLPPSIKVTLLGNKPNHEVLEMYKAMKNNPIFIHLSESEGGVPVAIQEAMSFGFPVVSTKVGGCSEIVVERETGWLLDEDLTPDKIARVLRLAFEIDANTYQKMANACQQIQRTLFQAELNSKNAVDQLFIATKPGKAQGLL